LGIAVRRRFIGVREEAVLFMVNVICFVKSINLKEFYERKVR